MRKIFLFATTMAFLLQSCNKESQIEGFITYDSDSTYSDNTPKTTNIGSYFLKNCWTGTYLSSSGSTAVLVDSKSTKWDVLKINGTNNVYLCIAGSKNYLSNNGSGQLKVLSTVSDKSVWELELISAPIYRIKNVDSGLYINNETGSLYISGILPGWLSAQWVVE
jgi:hypothetical protein